MQILENQSLESCNTLHFPCRAEFFAPVRDVPELQELLAWARQRRMPVTVLGGGSNVVLGEELPGLVILNQIQGCEQIRGSGAQPVLRVGAGENWHQLVLHTLAQGWAGLENLSLIPGAVGAAPIQNIGAYGVELAQCFQYLDTCAIADGSVRRFELADCAFGYRDSVFKNDCRDEYIITSVTLQLSTSQVVNTSYAELARELQEAGIESPTPREVSDTVIRIRSAKLPDPAEIGNAGSFFKNPVVGAACYARIRAQEPNVVGHLQADGRYKLAAGWLIDQCGWKGHREGAVGVHDRQALVLVHHGGGTARELLHLAERIQARVAERYGVSLEVEPRIYA